MDVRITFGKSGLNSGRIILTLWPAGPALRITFVHYLIAFGSRPEATSDAISGRFVGPVIPDNRVKFSDPRINRSPGIIPPGAV